MKCFCLLVKIDAVVRTDASKRSDCFIATTASGKKKTKIHVLLKPWEKNKLSITFIGKLFFVQSLLQCLFYFYVLRCLKEKKTLNMLFFVSDDIGLPT